MLPGSRPHRRFPHRPLMTSESTAMQALADQPTAIVERDGVRFTLLGTAHVSKASVDAVRAAIASGAFDQVAVELDPQRACEIDSCRSRWIRSACRH